MKRFHLFLKGYPGPIAIQLDVDPDIRRRDNEDFFLFKSNGSPVAIRRAEVVALTPVIDNGPESSQRP